jgi:sarcosine/dimethylglycine N-methyltransferase
MTTKVTQESATDPTLADALVAHWASRADLDFIRRDLERRGKDPAHLTVADLANHDQLHAGQLTATRDFAAWVGVQAPLRILDLGAGLGGAARLLAADHGCRVLAVELSPPLHESGAVLTQWLGLGPLVEHRCADLLADADHAGFDLVWLQHVDMHVPDKGALYARAASSLRRDGRVVWHDWLAGPGGPPHYPVVWSDGGELSFLVTPEALRKDARRAGLTITRLEIITERTHAWFSRTHGGLLRALGKLPDDAVRRKKRFTSLALRMENVLRNLDEQRLLPFYGEAILG